MKLQYLRTASAWLCLALSSHVLAAQPSAPSPGKWVDTWVSMPQLTEAANLPPPPFVSFQDLGLLWG
jgi:hypothetical protein